MGKSSRAIIITILLGAVIIHGQLHRSVLSGSVQWQGTAGWRFLLVPRAWSGLLQMLADVVDCGRDAQEVFLPRSCFSALDQYSPSLVKALDTIPMKGWVFSFCSSPCTNASTSGLYFRRIRPVLLAFYLFHSVFLRFATINTCAVVYQCDTHLLE